MALLIWEFKKIAWPSTPEPSTKHQAQNEQEVDVVTNSMNKQVDVLIVGAGPAGAMAANLLGQYNIRTLLIDRETEIVTIPRAVGMCDEGSRIVESSGLMAELESQLTPINDLYLKKQDKSAMFRFDCETEVNGHQILRSFYQPGLENILREGLKRFQCIEFWQGTECLQIEDLGGQVKCRLRRNDNTCQTVTCKYVIASDGARSSIRKMLGTVFKGYSYAQDWLVVDVKNDPVKDRSFMQFMCDPNRPGVTLPTPNGSRRWEFVVKKNEHKSFINSESSIRELLRPWGNIDDMEITRKSVYTFHAVVADQFRIGNVFLLGDAAHLTPPFAGQGLMAGFRDAANLCWKLAYVVKGALPPDILDTYNQERRPQAAMIVYLARIMGLFVLPQNPMRVLLRDAFFKMATLKHRRSNSLEKAQIRKLPNNIVGYRALLKPQKNPEKLDLGYELPNFRVNQKKGLNGNNQGTDTCLLDTALGNQFYLLRWSNSANSMADHSEHISPSVGAMLNQIDCRFCTIVNHENTFWNYESSLKRDDAPSILNIDSSTLNSRSIQRTKFVIDIDQKYQTMFKSGERWLLIRPDKMVVVSTGTKNLNKALGKYLSHSLQLTVESNHPFTSVGVV